MAYMYSICIYIYIIIITTIYIYSDILSDRLSDILSGIYSGILFYLAYVRTFYLAVFLACARAQACPAASRARDQLHPELAIGLRSRRAQMQLDLAMWLTTIETHSHDELQEEHTRSKGEEVVGGRVGGRRRRSCTDVKI